MYELYREVDKNCIKEGHKNERFSEIKKASLNHPPYIIQLKKDKCVYFNQFYEQYTVFLT